MKKYMNQEYKKNLRMKKYKKEEYMNKKIFTNRKKILDNL